MLRSLLKQSIGMMIGAALVLVMLQFTASVRANTTQVASATVIQEALASAPVLSYQGRLLDPATGQPKPDGAYTMQFKIYEVATAGAPLWSENKNVNTNKGLFATLLGDTTALETSIFDGRSLFLAISISGDPEITPRQPIAHNAYAIFAKNSDLLDGQDSTAFALDSEVMPIVRTNGGSGSGINADLLDGFDSSSFAKSYIGTQVNQTTPLASGGVETWFTFGYSVNDFVIWRIRPTTTAGKFKLDIEVELGNDGNITYYLRVTNTGSVASGYQLIRRTLYD